MIPARWQVTRATYRLPRNSTVLLCGRLEHVLICRRRRRSSAAGDTESRGSVWQDFITPQGVLGVPQADRGHHRLDVHLHRGSPTPNAAPATSCHLIHSQFFNAMPCGAEQSNNVFLGLLQIISNFHLFHVKMFDSILYQTFHFDFHGFCSDSPPLLARIDGPSVRFMTGAQLESSLMVERTMQGGTLPL